MTRVTVDVQVDEQGRPVFRLTPAQMAELGLSGSAAHEARWEVAELETSQPESPFRKYLGIAPPVEGGSVEYHRRQLGHEE
ncbi:hypothetical protein D3875_08495 [Deinococcus cavernae]|uniref:Uncharacterized protein n=1 Tax=Deinococcus cavernae TaxID=2320857 RepID=A0A418V678_9DEIO|nr:hypothetical protein [Deinococcus cavernae]RJF71607.1 hypothetical protein D3875_08495 [Deinococcus cavernae]